MVSPDTTLVGSRAYEDDSAKKCFPELDHHSGFDFEAARQYGRELDIDSLGEGLESDRDYDPKKELAVWINFEDRSQSLLTKTEIDDIKKEKEHNNQKARLGSFKLMIIPKWIWTAASRQDKNTSSLHHLAKVAPSLVMMMMLKREKDRFQELDETVVVPKASGDIEEEQD